MLRGQLGSLSRGYVEDTHNRTLMTNAIECHCEYHIEPSTLQGAQHGFALEPATAFPERNQLFDEDRSRLRKEHIRKRAEQRFFPVGFKQFHRVVVEVIYANPGNCFGEPIRPRGKISAKVLYPLASNCIQHVGDG